MDALEAIMTTRAMRRLRPDPVSSEDLWTCLRAAQQAPHGGNVQLLRYVVVTDKGLRARIGEVYRKAFDVYADAFQNETPAARHLADNIGSAPALVFFLMPVMEWGGGLDIGPLHASIYPAVQNFCLAARALGLGTTLTTVIRVHQAEALELLGVSSGFEIAALVPVGHPEGSFGVAARRDVKELVRWI
ncbi:nitroreductase [Lentzea sp. NBRC 105346]|uniref:nitroreductase family protein n=1 Tax=Lentzea sp. NBRC 105346 TaxID=3032205 RepID=UPI0024A2F00E|nr:nitroreductase family protein [Lentzea sp. NBRC 105346]GLZ28939.1 nitroreductase [Lentzea sp. NBRC 105346]